MKKRYTEEQIIRILKQAESGIPVADLLREHNIVQGTFYRWKAKYGGMEVNEAICWINEPMKMAFHSILSSRKSLNRMGMSKV